MFKSKSFLVRFIFNSLFAMGLFWFFNSLGWIVVNPGYSIWFVALVVTALSLITGFLLAIAVLLLSPLFVVLTILTLGLGLILLGPAMQYFSLLLISKVTLIYTITTVWWKALLIGLGFGLLRFYAPTQSK